MLTNRKINWICVIAVYWASLFLLVYYQHVNTLTKDQLRILIDNYTRGYVVKQILLCLLLFMAGYIMTVCGGLKLPELIRYAVSIPISVALWVTISVVFLVCRIPYTAGVALTAYAAIILLFIMAKRERLKNVNIESLGKASIIVAALSNVIATGKIGYFMSSDSYRFVMKFGEIIAHTGRLDFTTAGADMAETGVATALSSAMAVFAGHESIVILHFLLVTSIFAVIGYHVYQILLERDTVHLYAVIASVLVCVCLAAIHPFILLSTWIISNAWHMVFFFLFVYMVQYFYEDNKNNKWFFVALSLMMVWLAFSRIEGIVTLCFILICCGMIFLNRREYLIVSIPAVALQFFYILTVYGEVSSADTSAVSDFVSYFIFLNDKVYAVMALAGGVIVLFGLLYEYGFVRKLRERMDILLVPGLAILTLLLGVADYDRFIRNVKTILINFSGSARWGYLPILIAGMMIFRLKKVRSFDFLFVVIVGYALFQFDICMGRDGPLREGYGDSYNRMLLGMIPLCILYVINIVSEMGTDNERQKPDEKIEHK